MAGSHHMMVMSSGRGGNAGLGLVGVGAAQIGSSPSVPVPAGIASGDLLVIIGATNGSYSALTGWNNDLLNGGASLTVWHKWATGSETTIAVSASGVSAQTVCAAFRGWSTLDVVGTPVNTTTTATATGVTTTATGDLLLSIFAVANNTATWTSTPSGAVTAFDGSANAGRGLLLSYESWPTASATGSRAATSSVSTTVGGIVIAFKP